MSCQTKISLFYLSLGFLLKYTLLLALQNNHCFIRNYNLHVSNVCRWKMKKIEVVWSKNHQKEIKIKKVIRDFFLVIPYVTIVSKTLTETEVFRKTEINVGKPSYNHMTVKIIRDEQHEHGWFTL